MPRCCGSANGNCNCSIVAGDRVTVTGTGGPGDPIVISADVALEVIDNATFDLTIEGEGTVSDPRTLEVTFAPTAKLDHVPDVNAPTPSNGQVLTWDNATQRWVAASGTTAPVGAVSHDTSLAGDGSVGSPLSVASDPARYIGETAAGVGLTDTGMLSVVHHYATAAARTTAMPTPVVNALTILDTNPGVVDYWTGTAWRPLLDRVRVSATGQLLSLSGAYTVDSLITAFLGQVSVTTDASGDFDVLSAVQLTGYAGVLTATFQEITGAFPWVATVRANTDRITGTAYRVDTGAPMVSTPIVGTVHAMLYGA